MKKNLFCAGFILASLSTTLHAQDKPIIDVNVLSKFEQSKKQKIDLSQIEGIIQQAIQTNATSFRGKLSNLKNTGEFVFTERSILNAKLKAKFPNIKSYTGYSTTNPNQKISLSYSPSNGISAIIYSPSEKFVIEKVGNEYQIFDAKNLPSLKGFDCGEAKLASNKLTNSTQSVNNPNQYRKYKLAVATDYHFNQFFANGETPTLESSLAAVVQTLTYVSPVYENDLSITFELVDNTENVTHLTEESDPYFLINFFGFELTNLNDKTQEDLDQYIGSENYDVGIVLTGKASGGNAGGIGTVCNNELKGSSYAGGIGTGETFIQFAMIVAHELGHQFGANHVHARNENFEANREIGSGVTVMGYPGVTGTHDVTDAFVQQFNHYNLRQINTYLGAQSCGITTPSTNQAPVANAGNDYNIPKGTPFRLSGTATDADQDRLTYSWEQSNPLVSDTGMNFFNPSSTNTEGANFRIYAHQENPVAYFPPLKQVLSGNLRTTWTNISDVERDLKFVFQVRDNQPQGGQIASDEVTVAVKDVGPFKINNVNLNQTIRSGEAFTIQWDVADTNNSEINVQNVAIKLTTDNGETFTTLLASTPNTGSATFTIPQEISAEKAYIFIEAIDNIFYAVSPEFAINYEISLECNVFENATSTPIPDHNGTDPGIINANLTIANETGTLENFSIITDVTHPNQGELAFLFAKADVDTRYQFVTYANCSGSENHTYRFNEFGGNLFDQCGIENASNAGTSVDFSRYVGTPINGNYIFRFADISPNNAGTINKVAVEACKRVATTLSIDQLVKNDFALYPNPNNGEFNIRLGNPAEKVSLEVINLAGQSIYQKQYNSSSNEIQVNVNHLPKGVYVVKIDDGKEKQTKKIIIK